jgi:pimeloyl-ACP methyl ester carboxylesterase
VHQYRLAGEGKGPPLVFVHGLAGNANGFFRVIPPSARRFKAVYALDLPGNGFSPLPASGPMPVESQVELLHRYVTEVIGEPALVVGNSLGGALSLGLAERHPESVRALGLIAPAGARYEAGRLAELLASLRLNDNKDARRLARRLFAKPPLALLLFASVLRQVHGTPAVQALFDEAEELQGFEPQVLGGLKMPLLLLWGGQEKLLPMESIDYFRAHMPAHAEVEVVPNFGHVPQLEHPKQVVERLTRFADANGL